MRRTSGAWLAALGVSGCLGCHPAKPVAPPTSIAIPSGCASSLAGRWVHAADPGYTYLASDDGRLLTLQQLSPTPLAVATPDGGTKGAEIRLERTGEGFSGEVHAQAMVAERVCDVSFPAEVVSCSPDELTLRATPSRSIDATCQVAPMTPAPWIEHVLKRVPNPPSPALKPGLAPTPTP